MPARKKDPSVRARRNTASTAAVLPADAKAAAVPDLPGGVRWHANTRAFWHDVWSSPMSSEYLDSDVHALVVIAVLVNSFWNARTAGARRQLAAEIRLQRAAFGLTPYDRRRLEWTIEAADEAKARGQQRRARSTPAQPTPANDPRRGLAAV